ncbi:hypothetical protein Tco_0588224 [Tanacetum coccineum]
MDDEEIELNSHEDIDDLVPIPRVSKKPLDSLDYNPIFGIQNKESDESKMETIMDEEYIRIEEEKARRHGRTFNWKIATFGKVKNYEDEDDYFIDFKTEFPAIVFDNTTLPSEPTVCPPNENKVDFRISLDEPDDEDYMSEKDNDDNDIDIIQSSEGNETTPMGFLK